MVWMKSLIEPLASYFLSTEEMEVSENLALLALLYNATP